MMQQVLEDLQQVRDFQQRISGDSSRIESTMIN
jgi:hypothetical protein